MKSIILAMAIFVALVSNADARRLRSYAVHPECNVTMPCEGVRTSPRGERVVRAMGGFGVATKSYSPRAERAQRVRHAVRHQRRHNRVLIASVNPRQVVQPQVTVERPAVTPAGIVPQLASKAAEIIADCGSRIVSGVRNTFIAGTRTKSLHASGQAVDMVGNPSCIAKHLQGWAGGASNDYGRVGHYHISWGGREHGIRFAHGGGRRYAHRHHHRRHVRYASAWR